MTRTQKLALFSAAVIAVTAPGPSYAKVKEKSQPAYQEAAPIPLEELQAKSQPPIFSSLRWKNRAIVITGEPDDAQVAEQLQVFRENIAGLKERRLVMIRFLHEDLDEIDELSDYNYRGWYDMDANEQSFMERQLGTDNNKFSVVLVGLDGELKQVWMPEQSAVPINWIFSAVDAMPMRQREQKEK